MSNTPLQHHAYLIEASRGEGANLILRELSKRFDFTINGNPDVSVFDTETFGIEDARSLKDRASVRPLGERKFLIILCRFLTREAQNALLKLFEEPPEGTLIFLCGVPRKSLLPTLQSRLAPLSLESTGVVAKDKAKHFLSLPVGKRLEYLKEFASDGEGGKRQKSLFANFLSGLEAEVRERFSASPQDARLLQNLSDISQFKSFLEGRAPSMKMLGEFLALTLPISSPAELERKEKS